MPSSVDLNQLSQAQLRDMAAQLLGRLGEQDARLAEQDTQLSGRDEAIQRYRIREEQLTHEIALLKRHSFGKRAKGISRSQYSLLGELVEEDPSAIERELEHLAQSHCKAQPTPRTPKRRNCRAPRSARAERYHLWLRLPADPHWRGYE